MLGEARAVLHLRLAILLQKQDSRIQCTRGPIWLGMVIVLAPGADRVLSPQTPWASPLPAAPHIHVFIRSLPSTHSPALSASSLLLRSSCKLWPLPSAPFLHFGRVSGSQIPPPSATAWKGSQDSRALVRLPRLSPSLGHGRLSPSLGWPSVPVPRAWPSVPVRRAWPSVLPHVRCLETVSCLVSRLLQARGKI